MSKIIDKLYVAGAEETFKNEDLKLQVSHFLNVASEDDDENSDIRTILSDCINWIDEVITKGGSVCVHCLEGKSRSVCVCIAYLCIKQNWDFNEACEWLKNKRPTIDIYPLYYQQIKMYTSKS
jgi:protein-tyrosine phosphatase